jgi:hypothetical protein
MSDIVERLRLDAEPTESDMEEAATEIERLRARVEKMRAGTITLEVMLKLFAKREELLAVVRAMREEAKP